MPETLMERRERARRLATTIVSFAIMAFGVAILVFAVTLVVRGSLPLIFLAVMLIGIALVVTLGGFFFHLLPSRIDALADEKRAYDRRVAEEAARGGQANGNGDGNDPRA